MARSTGHPGAGGAGPTIEDCNRLWTTIVQELVTDAEIIVELQTYPLGSARPKLIVRSPGVARVGDQVQFHTWATTELRASNLAFTYSQLYDLLIEAYRKMEGYLGGQNEMPLP